MDLLATTPAEKDKVIDRLMANIRFTGGRDNFYNVTYQDKSPELAQRVVQNFVSMFVESGLSDKRRDTEASLRFVEEQIKELESQMGEVDNRIREFRLANMFLLGGGSTGSYIGQVSSLNDELNRVRLELRSAEQSRDALKQQLEGENPSLALPDPSARAAVSVTPQLDARIDAQRRQVDELLRRYTEQHPDVINSRRVIAQLEEERRQAIVEHAKATKGEGKDGAPTNPVFQQIKIAISEAEANVASLRARSAEIKARIDRLTDAAKRRPEIESEMNSMQREQAALARRYQQLVSRRDKVTLGEEVSASGVGADFRLIEPPRASPKPVFPDRMALVGLVLGLSLGAGLFASFAYAQIFPTVADSRSLRQLGGRPVLGSVSLLISGSMLRRRRLQHVAFGSGLATLILGYGAWTAWVAWVLKR
jgi:polysaccharide chain length determinant protein (PEP-CTERM system associated)